MRQPGNVVSAQEDERVERVAVLAERSLDEAVVGGIGHRREQATVEHDVAGLGIDLVLLRDPIGTSTKTVASIAASLGRVGR